MRTNHADDGIELQFASSEHLSNLLPLVRVYHAFEGISFDEPQRDSAVRRLLEESDLGRIWMIQSQLHVSAISRSALGTVSNLVAGTHVLRMLS